MMRFCQDAKNKEKIVVIFTKLEFAFVLKITILFPQGSQMYLSKLKWDQLPSLFSTDILLKYDNNARGKSQLDVK